MTFKQFISKVAFFWKYWLDPSWWKYRRLLRDRKLMNYRNICKGMGAYPHNLYEIEEKECTDQQSS